MPNPDVYLRSLAPPSDVLLSESAAESTGDGVTGTATFSQAAATWESTATEQLDATAAFLQAPAAWDATGSEEIAGTATFSQDAATWTASDLQPVSGTATFNQEAATWDASATAPTEPTAPAVSGGSYNRYVKWRTPKRLYKPKPKAKVKRPPQIVAVASFVQQPARWRAEMHVRQPEDWLLGIGDTDESLLALV